ncbi:MAG: hypothetical protein AAGK10_18655 [Cyanobacteria bacterium J06555_3]
MYKEPDKINRYDNITTNTTGSLLATLTKEVERRSNIVSGWDTPDNFDKLFYQFEESFSDIERYLFEVPEIKEKFSGNCHELRSLQDQIRNIGNNNNNEKKDPEDNCDKICETFQMYIEKICDFFGRIANALVRIGGNILQSGVTAIANILGIDSNGVNKVVAIGYQEACSKLARLYQSHYKQLAAWARNKCYRICTNLFG